MLKYNLFLSLILAFATLSAANTNRNEAKFEEREAIIRKDQMDPTDIFAIPLDDSEEEEDEEMEMLKRREQKYLQKQQQKQQQQQPQSKGK